MLSTPKIVYLNRRNMGIPDGDSAIQAMRTVNELVLSRATPGQLGHLNRRNGRVLEKSSEYGNHPITSSSELRTVIENAVTSFANTRLNVANRNMNYRELWVG